MTFRTLVVQRIPDRTGKMTLEIKASWENGGTTPAIHVIKFMKGAGLDHEPAGDEFLGSRVLPRGSDLSIGVMAPKGQSDSGSVSVDQAELFDPAAIARGVYLWGWVAYRDVFNRTAMHVTEFCQRLVAVRVPDDPRVEPGLTLNGCEHHNCTDEDCGRDYRDLVEITGSLNAQ